MEELERLRMVETILSFSYWENWDYLKKMSRTLGGKDPKMKIVEIEVNKMREEWNEIQKRIKEIEDGLHIEKN